MTKEEFALIKEQMIKDLKLKEIPDERFVGYYFDEDNVELYSLRKNKIKKLKVTQSFGGYLFYCLTPADYKGRQETVYTHWISHSVNKGVSIGSWTKDENGKRVTLHHRDGNVYNNHYSNITPTLNQHDKELRRKMSEQAKGRSPKKMSDEDVIKHRKKQKESGIAVTTYAREISKHYGMDEISVYNILSGRSRKNIAI
ncbi:hypothetical protein [Bacillus sp. Au-Bac7]|uniref:hypothetical protein n=1 Tax=Bacillus sp. Au-Bac7 TaxID=2906458 RepID=UPI001E3F5A9A|nr:hypothetical protein [Bacillus sp. Au-Bac7]MCE4051902.1 hypothetical protein [Bacillus sp. Au-Bac7]